MTYFIINHIFEVALVLTIVFLKIGWMVDKVKVKKDILHMRSDIVNIKKDISIMQDSISKLRNSNHNIANIVNKLNMKAQHDEGNNKIN
jgi:hypothetical protein